MISFALWLLAFAAVCGWLAWDGQREWWSTLVAWVGLLAVCLSCWLALASWLVALA